MMFVDIARFEVRYLLRNPVLWVTAIATFAFFFVSMATDVGLASQGGLFENGATTTLRNYVVVSIVFMFVTTSFVANVVIRDDETGFGTIIRSTRITKFQYLIGRFVGAFVVAALCLLLVPAASWLGSLMPSADPSSLGPNRLADHLYGYFLIALPNLFVTAAIFFALGTMTRSMMATYLGVIVFISGYFSLERVVRGWMPGIFVAIAEPFGATAIGDATHYWTIAERNGMLPAFSGALLYNRLLWIAVALLALALAFARYHFSDQGVSKRESKKQQQAERAYEVAPRIRNEGVLPLPQHGSAALRSLVWMRTRFEAAQVIKSPAFALLMIWGLFLTFYVLLTQRDPDGRPSYPTTLSMVPEIAEAFSMIPLIVAIYYASDLVWRERDRKIYEIIDATPLPNWAYVIPKTVALALVLFVMLLVNVLASILVQLSLGYTALELGKYVLWYVLPASFDMLIIAALAIFVQSLSPHKAVGWGIMVLFVMLRAMTMGSGHNMINFGAAPDMPLSDLNGAGSFWMGAFVLRLYWGAFAGILLIGAHLLWRRGTNIRLKPRLALARRRLAGPVGRVAGAVLLLFTATGAYAYYNTNILNEYIPADASEAAAAEFEKRYMKYIGLPQPTMTDLKLDVALYPQERRAVTRGRTVLRNLTTQSISDIHVRWHHHDYDLGGAIAGARMVHDDAQHGYRIFRLDAPMQPDEERVMTFETRRWHRGFVNGSPHSRLIENGTFMTTPELMPVIGMSPAGTLSDPAARRKYGLPDLPPPAKLEDVSAAAQPSNGEGWTKADITVSTSSDQTPIAPGRRVSDITSDGRRTARFVSDAPILMLFSVQSARYAEKHRNHAGVDLGVYYHPGHEWNVDRMLDALAASLDYYQAHFGPYQFDHVRIVEFPGFEYYAQALPGTIAYSEDLGFVSDYRVPETVDHVTFVTAHELAHQYWGHQVRGAQMEGAGLLTETLSQYSAMMVARKLYGKDKVRRALQFQLNQYLQSRADYGGGEPPLARVLGQSWIATRKGAVVMYLLQERLGEEAVNRALRALLKQYKFAGPPYPRSVDFIKALRAEASTEEQQALITDLFERVTLYDLKVGEPIAIRRTDGRWDVTVPVEAKKLYVEEDGAQTNAPLNEHIEVGLFTAEPGRDAFDTSHVILMERHPIRTGKQVLTFVSDRKPVYAGVDPYNFYIDRSPGDNVVRIRP